jgi:hypothetical protein
MAAATKNKAGHEDREGGTKGTKKILLKEQQYIEQQHSGVLRLLIMNAVLRASFVLLSVIFLFLEQDFSS